MVGTSASWSGQLDLEREIPIQLQPSITMEILAQHFQIFSLKKKKTNWKSGLYIKGL